MWECVFWDLTWIFFLFFLCLCCFYLVQFWFHFQKFLLSLGSFWKGQFWAVSGALSACSVILKERVLKVPDIYLLLPHWSLLPIVYLRDMLVCCSQAPNALLRWFPPLSPAGCRLSVDLRLLVGGLYPCILGFIYLSFVASAAPNLLTSFSKSSAFMWGLSNIKHCIATTAFFPESSFWCRSSTCTFHPHGNYWLPSINAFS